MEKILTYKTERRIKYLPIKGEYVAVRDEIYLDDKLTAKTEGITTAKVAEECKYNEDINFSNLHLCKSELLTDNITKPRSEVFSNLSKYMIANPYTYITENGLTEVKLLDINMCEYSIYDSEGKIQPQSLYFDHVYGLISDAYYDLEYVMNKLSQRTDIKFLKGGVSKIKGYSEDAVNEIAFIWTPSHKDYYDMIKNVSDNSDTLMLNFYVAANILGLGEPLYRDS